MSDILGVTHTVPGALPPGACDCHVHVFGNVRRFPFAAGRTYTPPEADAELLIAHQQALGLDRVVVVQPSPYGTDNSCTLDAVMRLGDRARAVAVVDPLLPLAGLRALHDGGVRGVRANLETAGVHDPAAAREMLLRMADQVAAVGDGSGGWHLQTYTSLGVIAALHDVLSALPVPLVVDHFGRAMAAGGTGQAGFDALLDLVRTGRAYVKLSAAHRIADDPDEAGEIAAALIAANPARMLWGSDWPHPGSKAGGAKAGETKAGQGDAAAIEPYDPVDDGAALERLRRWTGDAGTFRAVLVDNPARVYGF